MFSHISALQLVQYSVCWSRRVGQLQDTRTAVLACVDHSTAALLLEFTALQGLNSLLFCSGFPGEYTAEKLAALQAATQKLPAKLKPAATGDSAGSIPAEAAAGGVIKLSGSFRQAPKQSDDRFTYSYSIHGTMSGNSAATIAAAAGGASAAAAAGSSSDAGRSRAGRGQAGAGAPAAGLANIGATDDRPPEDEEAMPLPPPPRPAAAAPNGSRAATTTADRAGATAADLNGAGTDGDDDEDGDDDAGGFHLPNKETIR